MLVSYEYNKFRGRHELLVHIPEDSLQGLTIDKVEEAKMSLSNATKGSDLLERALIVVRAWERKQENMKSIRE